MEIRVVYGQRPPKNVRFALKNPYTQYTKPDFNPHHYFDFVWIEHEPEIIRVISKIEFPTLEECKIAFEKERAIKFDVSDIVSDINERMEKTRQLAKEQRENFRDIMNNDDFYPTGLYEYMERLRRKKYVKDKRKREKQKVLAMMPTDAKLYIKKKMEELNDD